MIPAGVEILVALTPIDLRLGFDRLAGLVEEQECPRHNASCARDSNRQGLSVSSILFQSPIRALAGFCHRVARRSYPPLSSAINHWRSVRTDSVSPCSSTSLSWASFGAARKAALAREF
ncbi:MAG: hypothetical protein JWN04_5229 [Myxococcaceae bacterium]|nr:hypothetical protein [Myxococcaceae bacterium]